MQGNYSAYHAFIESVCAELGCRELARPLKEGFSVLCESAWNFDMHQDLYSDRPMTHGLYNLPLESALPKAFCRGAGIEAIERDDQREMYGRILDVLRSCTDKDPLTVYRGIWIPIDQWDGLVSRVSASSGVSPESPEFLVRMLSNTSKEFNSFTTSRYVAKMYMDGGDDTDDYTVQFMVSGKAYPEDIDYLMSMANNARDMCAGVSSAPHEIVVKSARLLEDFRVVYSNLDKLPLYTPDRNVKDCYRLNGNTFLRTVFNPGTGLYRIERMIADGPGKGLIGMPEGKAAPASEWYRRVDRVGDGLYRVDDKDGYGGIVKVTENGITPLLGSNSRIVHSDYIPDGYLLIFDGGTGKENLIVRNGPSAGALVFPEWKDPGEIEDGGDEMECMLDKSVPPGDNALQESVASPGSPEIPASFCPTTGAQAKADAKLRQLGIVVDWSTYEPSRNRSWASQGMPSGTASAYTVSEAGEAGSYAMYNRRTICFYVSVSELARTPVEMYDVNDRMGSDYREIGVDTKFVPPEGK